MSSGLPPAKIESGSDLGPSQLRMVGCLNDADDRIHPAFSTESFGSPGIVAAAYKVSGQRSLSEFALDDICVAFLHSGKATANFERASVIHTFGRGGLFVTPPASIMALRISDIDCTVIHLKPDRLPCIDPDVIARREIVPQIDPIDLQLTFLIACVREELQGGLPGGRQFMESLGLAMTHHLFARYSTGPSPTLAVRGGLTPRQLRCAQETMLAALEESVPLATLAHEAGLSPWHFCRAFKQSTGLSPHRWMRDKRLEQARYLLADNRRSLTSIAIKLGYASLSHFSAAFKQATGISPTGYRRNLQS